MEPWTPENAADPDIKGDSSTNGPAFVDVCFFPFRRIPKRRIFLLTGPAPLFCRDCSSHLYRYSAFWKVLSVEVTIS